MAATDEDTVEVLLQPDSATEALPLSVEAGWNQTLADWLVFLESGSVFGLRTQGGTLVATAALLPYTPSAWISMVLVTAGWRRRGLASRLMSRCIATARERKLQAWLDATPAGATVYGPMGFTGRMELARCRHVAAAAAPTDGAFHIGALDDLLARDHAAMHCDRSALLQDFALRPGSRVVARDSALALVRDGRTARHIGPLYAAHAADAFALVHAITRAEGKAHLIDAVDGPQGFREQLIADGWAFERPFTRMSFPDAKAVAGAGSFAVAGPEFG